MKRKVFFAVLFIGFTCSAFGQNVKFDYVVKDGKITITGLIASSGVKDLIIPASIDGWPVVAIGAGAFEKSQLTSVTLPNSVVTIGERAFLQNKLTSIIIPNSVVTIGTGAFWVNPITSVVIPNTVLNYSRRSFSNTTEIRRP
ncbi:MAG: leucine-rich repeat domain-containing protein [Treponema sp.]|jgi:hypothetical protein|nr:leucine-rich repeat domain-containing protein [Treponema sp.]